ncbi:lipid-A-disaccharide synthase [Dolichospermum sp. LEGE 00240]|jgi:lipid-A-disaccharide synthase|uniref:lipid-A-disaccharide synthase n=1 Tax=Dolichospermum sp. LEGE 00240 TaxID=1828603 RepID=UPI00187EF34B|nr:lipid-A-disaccharide synthase [Dolichospermum sp. LEGE 00240]MBE9249927.1 lipid-A-disaccharide synthase [Dolichospermum sp. LEGE 00240]MDM3843921.1 lipid-A-disaccharide synthase [Aphanizomenon gracile PMC638.10]MDM3858156.1 lipid-A-disaccharide synthase [Aphanizomenon gracile PMC649.10]MDM3861932.1 lipid-A-disaccharide synthase [Aphanizomenon gracile PMC644.10]
MRIFISTGEVSGDLQGSLLIKALQRQAAATGLTLEIMALGGDKMAEAGAKILGNTSGIGSMGLIESLPYVIPTLRVQRQAIAHLKKNPPDLVVLIDYMGPNLGIGTFMKENLPDVPVAYYIAPQEWVWSMSFQNTNRIVGFTDKLLAIFPEEARYYQQNGANVSWVGHPLIDRMANAPSRTTAREKLGVKVEEIAIALLPASRHQELKYLLPIIFQAAQNIQSKLPNVHFWIPLSLETFKEPITAAIQEYGLKATIVSSQQQGVQDILAAADFAITKSGTVNLELALLNVPQVVVYRLHPLTAWIARHILKGSIPFASPVNLVVMREIVPEFLQEQATAENITQAAMELLLNPEKRQQTLTDYQEMRHCLGELGVCDRTAKEILEMYI